MNLSRIYNKRNKWEQKFKQKHKNCIIVDYKEIQLLVAYDRKTKMELARKHY